MSYINSYFNLDFHIRYHLTFKLTEHLNVNLDSFFSFPVSYNFSSINANSFSVLMSILTSVKAF